ncbi:cytochrome bd oxidase small subunit CydS [Ectobacillus funiculus]|uniref:Uncharacterized protein n=1 Tax=Ectobacillus funiculus TaxID=137993 RepID=A0ABV5WFL5_9BACI
MSHFLIFYAPILIVILSIVAAFWLASKDNIVSDH